MKKKLFVNVSIIVSFVFGVLLFFFGEIWFVGSIVFFGPVTTFFIYFVVSLLICFTIFHIYYYHVNSGNKLLMFVKNWIVKKEKGFSPLTLKIVNFSKFFGILFSTIVLGPLPTTVLICLLSYNTKLSIIVITTSNILFFLVWILIYYAIINNIFYWKL
ncbi:MAG: hypothetical protein ACD_26C00062G0003 [uncultured bacterium]|nr:MAG: hypothetical protein ACD_26C00062G0003 [uncultured bacterium]